MPKRDIKALHGVEEADAAFVVGPVIEQKVGLSYLAQAIPKGPYNGKRNRVHAVSNRVGDPVFISLDGVMVRPVAECQSVVRLQGQRINGGRQGVGHRAGSFLGRFGRMTLSAGSTSDISRPWDRPRGLPIHTIKMVFERVVLSPKSPAEPCSQNRRLGGRFQADNCWHADIISTTASVVNFAEYRQLFTQDLWNNISTLAKSFLDFLSA
jgi:hypothetical protein